MNTIYKPIDTEFLEMLAAAKARGVTWMRLAEMTKKPVVELEVIPWREPKAWAKACKYAEKLVQHEALSEMLAQLRVQMNDNVNNARSKSQVANSVVRTIQLQHALRTPKKPKKSALRPTPEPTPTVNEPTTPPPMAHEPPAVPPPTTAPKPANVATPLATVAAALLLVLFGARESSMALPTGEAPLEIAAVDRFVNVSAEQNNSATTIQARSDSDSPRRSSVQDEPCSLAQKTPSKERQRTNSAPQPLEPRPSADGLSHTKSLIFPGGFAIKEHLSCDGRPPWE